MKQKNAVCEIFIKFQCLVEHQFDSKIKHFQLDWRGEFHALASHFK